jgi:hypothetical protein
MTEGRHARAIAAASLLSAVTRWTATRGISPQMQGAPRERAARLTALALRKYDRELAAGLPRVSLLPDVAVRELRSRRGRAVRTRASRS